MVEQRFPEYQYSIRRFRDGRWQWTVCRRNGGFYDEIANGFAHTVTGAKLAASGAIRRHRRTARHTEGGNGR